MSRLSLTNSGHSVRSIKLKRKKLSPNRVKIGRSVLVDIYSLAFSLKSTEFHLYSKKSFVLVRMLNIPELRNEITKYLPNSAVLNFLEATLDPAPEPLKIWNRIFNDNGEWLDYAVANHNVQPVLLCGNFQKRSPYIILCLMDWTGDLQDEKEIFKKSLRTYKKDKKTGLLKFKQTSKGKALKRKGLKLRVIGLQDEWGDEDFNMSDWEAHRLFSHTTSGDKLSLKYCLWTDTDRRIRTVKKNDIRGINGTITEIKDLAPIFTVNLPITPDKGPLELVFSWGASARGLGVTKVHMDDKMHYYEQPLVDHWTFTRELYSENRYRIKDWTRVHEQDAIVEGEKPTKRVKSDI
ncbi:hypothetical protein BU24DRAFT_415983 [Aaosphaeria arxii CBS 175.79]|uniref:Uncharacterized protein n=1 Tax=Aaosphaeria arxii CBS 175.79 TaxID=1450172 RepID=A0A6A5X5X9_9PLEO|nr:uncharacterized protein BU24DRAFT_415983 [Aaosphaeria arxii CBS 175.79]KAF2008349.1 hypothetical protein BU24DRAFT_415983 [Aaosphaeria arxii CBS 175.79]